MVILAFLQNMWVRDPKKAGECIARSGEEYRRRLITYSLFAGCLTGRRLKAAFGQELCGKIVWEEASREIAGDARTVCRPDRKHIAEAIRLHKPDAVVTFGQVAGDAVAQEWTGKLIRCCHPAARQPETVKRLEEAARGLGGLMSEGGTA